jgi:hypothetical protein
MLLEMLIILKVNPEQQQILHSKNHQYNFHGTSKILVFTPTVASEWAPRVNGENIVKIVFKMRVVVNIY